MKKEVETLLKWALKEKVSDIHFVVEKRLLISFRFPGGIKEIKHDYDERLFEYLKFISNLDISGHFHSQSGSFKMELNMKDYFFRFSYIQHLERQSGVLRILNNHSQLTIKDLSNEKTIQSIFKKWTKKKNGFVLFSGPTGSGKSTTVHVLLEEIATRSNLKVVTLEDPIEIYSDTYLQMQINEKTKFTYEEGIKQLLRQDPDVIMIGEIRDAKTAQMAFRAALSGHMVFTTIHSKSVLETIKRFSEFGIDKNDIKHTVTGIVNQRLFKKKGKKEVVVIYDILQEAEIVQYLEGKNIVSTLEQKIIDYYEKGWIKKEDAEKEITVNL